MKKQLILIGIVTLLVCVGLSGCTSEIYKEKILGTWLRTYPKTENISILFTFFSNGTYAITIWNTNTNNKNTEYSSYKITDKTLSTKMHSTGKIVITEYSFSDNYNKLTLVGTDNSSNYSIFLRQN